MKNLDPLFQWPDALQFLSKTGFLYYIDAYKSLDVDPVTVFYNVYIPIKRLVSYTVLFNKDQNVQIGGSIFTLVKIEVKRYLKGEYNYSNANSTSLEIVYKNFDPETMEKLK